MKPPKSVLVIVTRRIGDVLLTTPLIRSLRHAWPHATIDALVFAGTEGALGANPDIRRIITIAERPDFTKHVAMLFRIARRYDVALSAVPGDRPTLYAWLAGRWRSGFVLDQPKHRWKTWLLQKWVPFDELNTHTVLMHLELARALAVERCFEVVAASHPGDRETLERLLPFGLAEPYAVLHVFPKFNYKMWRREAWVETARWLHERGLRMVLSGGGDDAELDYVATIARQIDGAVNLAGKLTLGQAASLLSHAKLYVGPDTALTHMAAALGTPVVALYGPGNPVKWGPWPADYTSAVNPWRRFGSQRVNNVILVQGEGACVPCMNEGCDRNIASYSDCLQHMTPEKVTAAMSEALALRT